MNSQQVSSDADGAHVLVTGATGLVGAAVLRQLLAERHEKPWRVVRALVRTEEAAARVRALGAEAVIGDLLDGSERVRGAIAGAPYIVHCANPPMQHPDARPSLDLAVLDALDPSRLTRFLYVCGSSYYGVSSEPIDETATPRPFGTAPFFEDGLARLRRSDIDWVAAYVAGVYGPGSWFLESCLAAIRAEAPIPVLDPAPIWPFIHIEDCARAISFLLAMPPAMLSAEGRDVIITDDHPVPMDVFIEALARAVGKEPRLERLGAEALRARLPPMSFEYLSANMAHRAARLRRLGFSWKYPDVREGIAALGPKLRAR